jgi:hypothetical protein
VQGGAGAAGRAGGASGRYEGVVGRDRSTSEPPVLLRKRLGGGKGSREDG